MAITNLRQRDANTLLTATAAAASANARPNTYIDTGYNHKKAHESVRYRTHLHIYNTYVHIYT